MITTKRLILRPFTEKYLFYFSIPRLLFQFGKARHDSDKPRAVMALKLHEQEIKQH